MSFAGQPRIQQEPVTIFAKRVKKENRKKGQEKMRQKWEETLMYGWHLTRVNTPDADIEMIHKWLKRPSL